MCNESHEHVAVALAVREGAEEPFVPSGLVVTQVALEQSPRPFGVERFDGRPSAESDVLHEPRGWLEVDDPDCATRFLFDPVREGVGSAGADDPDRLAFPQKPDRGVAWRTVDGG